MSAPDSFIIVTFALVAAVGGLVGFVFGERRGRDSQWVDDYLERARKERERRDRYGRFVVKSESR